MTEAPSAVVRARLSPSVVIAFVLAVVIASLVVSNWPMKLPVLADSELFQKYWPQLADGLRVTLSLVGISIPLGSLLAFGIAAARMSRNKLLAGVAFGFVYFFRGTPLLAQTFLVYFGAGEFRPQLEALGLWRWFAEGFWCVLLTFTLNTAAYQAEILRGAILAVPEGQREGGMALGLPKSVVFAKIVLPQALITALRPYGNEIILMIKGSAVASLVTVFDIMGATKLAYARSYDFQVYLWAAFLYLLLVETLRHIWDFIEARITRHIAR